jgi:hypothetical protein
MIIDASLPRFELSSGQVFLPIIRLGHVRSLFDLEDQVSASVVAITGWKTKDPVCHDQPNVVDLN